MAILVECVCGRRLKARDELAGKTLPCPACGTPQTVPIFTSAEAESDPDPLPRPFWKDPIIIVGAAFPTIALLGFATYYFAWERPNWQFKERVLALAKEADAAPKGDLREALGRFDLLIAYAGDRDPRDEGARDSIARARTARDRLRIAIKAQDEELERQAERRRLVQHQLQLYEAERKRAEQQRQREEAERLAREARERELAELAKREKLATDQAAFIQNLIDCPGYVPIVGDRFLLGKKGYKTTIMFSGRTAFMAWFKAAEASDSYGEKELENLGQVFYVPVPTSVLVLEVYKDRFLPREIPIVQVRFLDGERRGQLGWISLPNLNRLIPPPRPGDWGRIKNRPGDLSVVALYKTKDNFDAMTKSKDRRGRQIVDSARVDADDPDAPEAKAYFLHDSQTFVVLAFREAGPTGESSLEVGVVDGPVKGKRGFISLTDFEQEDGPAPPFVPESVPK